MDTKGRANFYTDAPAHHPREYVAAGIALGYSCANPQAKKPLLVQRTAFYSVRQPGLEPGTKRLGVVD